MNEPNNSRLRILADLVHDARNYAGRSAEDCAEVLGLPVENYLEFEAAEESISLPDLEVLAMYLQVPMGYFWGSVTLKPETQADYEIYVSLRQRIIGAIVNQARIESGRTPEEIADSTGIDAERFAAYASGSEPIPYIELESLAAELGVSVQQLTEEQHGPLAKNESNLQMRRRFEELPPDVQSFVAEPINLRYLETAMRLSEMEAEKLRAIAEGILDITL